jgi:sugar O-acyltransferase (sialic acid O-acetyltransferase NeuD family)
MVKIILIGSGTHANSCIDVIETNKKNKVLYLVDKKKIQKKNYKLILEKEFIKKEIKGKNLHISIGQLKTGHNRFKIFDFYKKKGCRFPKIISKNSYISKKSKIGEGTIVFHKSVINRNAIIGKNCIINTGSIIEHDVKIEDGVHIAPGSVILGNCVIKKNSFIGSGSIIKQNTVIKKNSVIPANSYIKK